MRRAAPVRWKLFAASLVALGASLFCLDILGFVEGQAEAAAALAQGRPELRSIGLARDPRGHFDPGTGLFYVSVGCCSTGHTRGYVAGWNSVIRAAAASGVTDAASLKHKVTTLEAIKGRFAAASPISMGRGTSTRDPAGRFELTVGSDGSLTVSRSGSAPEYTWGFEVADADCVFADGGSTLCVMRDCGWKVVYETFDLDRAIRLQQFVDVVGERPKSGCPGPRSSPK